jgi:hypothetical protein
MRTLRVLVGGEGGNEIGNRGDDGVIAALLAKVRPSGWQIAHFRRWSDMPKLDVGAAGRTDERTLRALHQVARDHRCHAAIVLRDRDRNTPRERLLRKVAKQLNEASDVRLVLGIPIEMLESWLLTLHGHPNAETDPTPTATLNARSQIPPKSTPQLVNLVQHARLKTSACDSRSLRRFLREVAWALRTNVPPTFPWPAS